MINFVHIFLKKEQLFFATTLIGFHSTIWPNLATKLITCFRNSIILAEITRKNPKNCSGSCIGDKFGCQKTNEKILGSAKIDRICEVCTKTHWVSFYPYWNCVLTPTNLVNMWGCGYFSMLLCEQCVVKATLCLLARLGLNLGRIVVCGLSLFIRSPYDSRNSEVILSQLSKVNLLS